MTEEKKIREQESLISCKDLRGGEYYDYIKKIIFAH